MVDSFSTEHVGGCATNAAHPHNWGLAVLVPEGSRKNTSNLVHLSPFSHGTNGVCHTVQCETRMNAQKTERVKSGNFT